MVENWDLDLDQDRRDSKLSAGPGRAPKLVHKIMLSMPPGTSAKGVLAAARNFAREEFALKHRYAFVLHTNEPHPHVHLVVKAVSEQGMRLNIRKATLREWRREFARHLRDRGIAANASERAVRGVCQSGKIDGIFRAERRGASTHTRERVAAIGAELASGRLNVEPGKETLVRTRRDVEHGWLAVSDILLTEGRPELSAHVKGFVQAMPAPRTDKESLADRLLAQRRDARVRERPTSR